MFPVIEYIKTCLNGLRSRIEKVEKSISQALASVKEDIIQDIKNVRKESAEAIKSSTADWGQNDSNALDYVKNRTHYVLPATPIGSLDFTATATGTIAYTMTEGDSEFAIFSYFQNLRDKGEVLKVIVSGKEGLLAVKFSRGYFDFSGAFAGSVYWRAGNVLSLVVQNDFITFNQGDTYTVSFEDTTKPYYFKLDFNYIPDNVYHSENSPVKFGAGENSTVQGYSTTATGPGAHAEGNYTQSDGYGSHAEGSSTKATGSYSHAEGIYTEASGASSHAEGSNTKATGSYSHAEGNYTNASESSSHAEGNYTKATGGYSHAEGSRTEASGTSSHAEGDYTVANRRGMHAEGAYNLYDNAKFLDVVSLSNYSNWSDKYSSSEYTFDADTGYYTLVNAEPKNEAVIGLYYATSYQYKKGTIDILRKPISLISGTNYETEIHQSNLGTDTQGKYVHVVGNGVSSARSNAYTLDWDGNGWFAGDVFVGGASQDDGVKLLKAGEAIPIPQTASVGQVLAVKAVDENGKPTEWEVVEIPSGGGGGGSSQWKIIRDLTITENADRVDINTDDAGEAFSLHEIQIFAYTMSYEDTAESFTFLMNGYWGAGDPYFNSGFKSTKSSDNYYAYNHFIATMQNGIANVLQPWKQYITNLQTGGDVASIGDKYQAIESVSFVGKFIAGCRFVLAGRVSL